MRRGAQRCAGASAGGQRRTDDAQNGDTPDEKDHRTNVEAHIIGKADLACVPGRDGNESTRPAVAIRRPRTGRAVPHGSVPRRRRVSAAARPTRLSKRRTKAGSYGRLCRRTADDRGGSAVLPAGGRPSSWAVGVAGAAARSGSTRVGLSVGASASAKSGPLCRQAVDVRGGPAPISTTGRPARRMVAVVGGGHGPRRRVALRGATPASWPARVTRPRGRRIGGRRARRHGAVLPRRAAPPGAGRPAGAARHDRPRPPGLR